MRNAERKGVPQNATLSPALQQAALYTKWWELRKASEIRKSSLRTEVPAAWVREGSGPGHVIIQPCDIRSACALLSIVYTLAVITERKKQPRLYGIYLLGSTSLVVTWLHRTQNQRHPTIWSVCPILTKGPYGLQTFSTSFSSSQLPALPSTPLSQCLFVDLHRALISCREEHSSAGSSNFWRRDSSSPWIFWHLRMHFSYKRITADSVLYCLSPPLPKSLSFFFQCTILREP